MTSADIIAALHERWPDGDYVKIEEAPDSCDRMGGKIDLLALSCWRSRGLSIDAIEVKASMSDWARERDNPSKADFWWRHSDRFWLACPLDIAAKIKDQLPDGWGLLAVAPKAASETDLVGAEIMLPKVRIAVKAPRHQRQQLPWHSMVGLLRAASDTGRGALQRAEMRGRDWGYQQAKRNFERAA